MRITRIVLKDLGRHRELDLELAPGFTIIRGPNEAGKSTIQRGIELALFRKATATAAELDALRTWGSGEESRSLTRVDFIVEEEGEGPGGKIRHEGVLEKEFRGARGSVSLRYGGETITDPARADQVMADLTGIPNEAFFRSTASIRHQEMEDLDRDEGALRDRLQGSIGGGDRGSSRAKARLEEAIKALKSRGDKNPGRLKTAEEAVARAEAALQAGEAALTKLESDRQALAEARAARQQAEQGFVENRNVLEKIRQADRLRSEQAAAAERWDRYRQAAEAQVRLLALRAIPERSISDLRDALDRMRTMQSRVQILQETMREESGPEMEPDEPVPSNLPWALATGLIVIMAVATMAMALVTGSASALFVGLALVVVVAALLYLMWQRRLETMDTRRANAARDRERALRRQTRVGTEEGLRVAQSGVQNILRELGVPDITAAELLLVNEQQRRHDIATLEVQVAALLAGQSDADVGALRDQAALEMEQKAAALESLGPAATDARAHEKLEAGLRQQQEAIDMARDAEAAATARVDANPVDAEQVAGEAERLRSWRDQLEVLRRRLRIYEATLAAIDEAERGTMKQATRFLEQYVANDIARVTGGRYRKVQIDDRSLDIDVWAPEREDWVSASRLSKGTIDQVYLVARMGLVRLVTHGRKPPLILDDPFVTFDDQRAARAALLLRELSTDFQVVYLACSNRYDALADKVIELPGPLALDDTAPPAAAPTPLAARSKAPAADEEPEAETAPDEDAGGQDAQVVAPGEQPAD
jgi:DNA repair exonuclease SbcCD ATPase subunit